MKLICITGPPGSGKSFMASVAEELGLRTLAMGDIVREEALKKYGKSDKVTVGKYAKEIREKYGKAAVAMIIMDKIKEYTDEYIVIDGVRSPEEILTFKKKYDVVVIGVIASRETRYLRMVSRKRVDDISNIKDFIEREEREVGFGLYDVLYSSDIYFFNDDIDKEEAREKIKKLFKMIIEGSI